MKTYKKHLRRLRKSRSSLTQRTSLPWSHTLYLICSLVYCNWSARSCYQSWKDDHWLPTAVSTTPTSWHTQGLAVMVVQDDDSNHLIPPLSQHHASKRTGYTQSWHPQVLWSTLIDTINDKCANTRRSRMNLNFWTRNLSYRNHALTN